MKAVRIRIDDMKHPLGLGDRSPEISWNCEGGKRQSAYRIIAQSGDSTLWDTGKVESSSMTHILWGGEELKSRMQVSVSITLWDENGAEGEPSESSFEMGLLDFRKECRAQWISGDYKPKKGVRYPVDCFRKTFRTEGKEIRKARLYAAARGVYDVTLCGKRIEDFILAPGMTDYRKRIQYQTYDVTELLQGADQEKTIEIRLADGWFRGSVAAYGVTEVFGKQTSACAQLEITYADGTVQMLDTDSTFSWSNDGPITFADLKDGEHFDARKSPSYGGHAGRVQAPDEKVKIEASNNVSVTEHERFAPKLLTAKDGTKVFDFGQNFAGYPEFAIRGKKGQKLKFVCGEVLDGEGLVDLSGVQESKPEKGWSQLGLVMKLVGKQPKGNIVFTPEQTIHFICSGGEDHYKSSFTVFGFRYMEVLSEDGERVPEISPDNVRGIAVYSNLEQTGDFTCSDPDVNRLLSNTRWSMKSNFLDVPTDCPTRERLGWTGDAQIFFSTGSFLMNTAPFMRKWLVDMEDDQYPQGTISAVIPYSGVEMMYRGTGVSVGWADAVYLVPYRFYQKYGDRRLLARCWPMMEKYAEYLYGHLGMSDRKKAAANPDNAYTYEKGVHLGEWLEPEEFRDKVYGAGAKHPEECTAYLYLAMKTMGEIAGILGKDSEKAKMEQYAQGAKKAYDDLFVKTGSLHTKRQAKIVRPLALGLVDGKEKKEAQEDLKEALRSYDFRVGTGFLSTPFLLPELTKAGDAADAYRVLTNHKNPGWLYEVDQGATTVWEDWEGKVSRNHYSPGSVCEWLFESSAGIRVDGENHFVIAPVPDPREDGITEASAEYESIYGKASSSWKKENGHIVYTVSVPSNTTADLQIQGRDPEVLQPGHYSFTV